MHHLSSSWTIFLRLFLPVFWFVFFGCFTVAMFVFKEELGPVLGNPNAAWIFLGCYLAGVVIIYFSLWRLYRVDADDAYVYVTNYLKTYKYPFHQIRKIEEQDLGLFSLMTLRFNQKFTFGKKIFFLARKKNLQAFLEANADMLGHLSES